MVTGAMKHHRVCEWSLCNTIARVPQQKAARMSYSLIGGQLLPLKCFHLTVSELELLLEPSRSLNPVLERSACAVRCAVLQ